MNNENENTIEESLPRQQFNLCKRKVFLNIKYTNADSESIFKHLSRYDIAVDRVTRMRSRFNDNNRCFVIECTDIEFEQMKDEKLWYSGTTLRDFIGDINNDHALDFYPQKK